MNKYLTIMTIIGALLISPIGSRNALADTQPPYSPEEIPVEEYFLLDTLESFRLNADSVHEIAEFPVFFEGTLYQPDEYISYFRNGFEIELYFIHGLDDQGNDILYAYRTVQEAVSHIQDSSEIGASQQTRAKKNCYKPYDWYLHWNRHLFHFAYSFYTVPSNYQGYLVDVPYCAKWKWKKVGRIYVPYCAKRKKKDVKANAKHHVPGKEKDIMFEKRSILRYCGFRGTYCMKYVRICR